MIDGEIIASGANEKNDDFNITLPVTREQFGDFLTGIIGGKEKITAYSDHSLYFDLENSVNLAKAIVERVTRNNETTIVSSEFSIRFSNNRTYTEHSISAFSQLAPVGESDTQMVEMAFDFLGKFPKYDFPVRQSIRVLVSNDLKARQEGEKNLEPSALIDIYFVERTWGEDLASLCQKFLFEFSEADKEASRFKTFLETTHEALIGMAFIIGLALYFASPWIFPTGDASEIVALAPQQIDDIPSLASYLTELINPSSKNLLSTWLFSLVGMAIVIFFMAFVMHFTTVKEKRVSFGFTKSDRDSYQRLISMREKSSRWSIPAAIVAIGFSLLTGYIFEILKPTFGL